MTDREGKPVWVFTLEVRIPELGDGEEGARTALGNRLAGLNWAVKASWITLQGEWRGQRRLPAMDDTEPVPGERYELTRVEDLQPGDQIYMMARRRLVMAVPYHPEEMRPELLRIPMSDTVPGSMKMAPPFERDHLVPRLLKGQQAQDKILRDVRWAPYTEFGIPDPAAETWEAPAGAITIGATGYRDDDVIIYWSPATPAETGVHDPDRGAEPGR